MGQRRADWAAWVEPAVLVLLAPVAIFPTPHRFLLLLAIPLLWVWQWRRTGHFIERTPFDWVLVGLTFMVGVGAAVSYNPSLSLPSAAGVVYGVGLYYGVARLSKGPRALLGLFGLWLAAGLGLALLALLGARESYGLSRWVAALSPLADWIGRHLQTEAVNPNEFAGGLVWAMPTLALTGIAFIWRAKTIRAWVGAQWWIVGTVAILGSNAVALLALALMQSRGSDLGLGLTALILGLVVLPKPARWFALAGLVIVSVAGTVFVYLWLGPTEIYRTFGFLVGSVADRLEIWGRAIYFIQNAPLTGLGLHTFTQAVHVLFPMQRLGPQRFIDDAHNELLQAGVDLGLPGLVAFVALLVAGLWLMVETYRNRLRFSDRQSGWVFGLASLGLAGGLLAHFFYSLTDAVALGAPYGIIFWTMLALISSLHQHTQSAQ